MTVKSYISKKNYKHAMLDLETLSTKRDACIIQIALVPFELKTGKINHNDVFCINVSQKDCERYGLRVSPETVAWWMTQPKSVWESTQTNPQTLLYALERLQGFVRQNLAAGAHIWSHSIFDIPIIENAFDVAQLEVPWTYKDPCDIRTMSALAECEPKDFPEINNSAKHNALSDCIAQIEYVYKLYQRIRNR